MAQDVPTIAEVRALLISDFQTTYNTTKSPLLKSFIDILCTVLAAVVVSLYKYAGFLQIQNFVKYASNDVVKIGSREFIPLRELGDLVDTLPNNGTSAELNIIISVIQNNSILPSGSQLIGKSNGFIYATLTSVELLTPETVATVRAIGSGSGGSGVGSLGNLEPGEILTFVKSTGLNQNIAIVESISSSGTNADTEEEYRTKVDNRYKQRPQGGAQIDYYIWCIAVAGVANVIPMTGTILNTVNVFIQSNEDADGIPNQALLDAAYDATQLDKDGLASRRPVGAFVLTKPIIRTVFDISVVDLTVSDPATVKAQISAAITSYLYSLQPFVVGVTTPPKTDSVSQAKITSLVNGIVSANDGFFSTISVSQGTSPVTVYILDPEIGEFAKPGVITYD